LDEDNKKLVKGIEKLHKGTEKPDMGKGRNHFTGNFKKRILFQGLFFVFLVIAILPIFLLASQMIVGFFEKDSQVFDRLMKPRVLNVFVQTVIFACSVTVFGTLISVIASSYLFGTKKGFIRYVRILIPALAFIPPYVHALAWISMIGFLDRFINASFGWNMARDGLGISIWVQTMALLPYSLALCIVGFESVDQDLLNMARLNKPDMKVFSKVLLPLAAPTVFTSSIFLFLFCLLDYTVPSLFGVNLYSLEIFASFSADYHTGNALIRSLPIILLVVPVALILSRNVKQLMTTVKHKNHSDASLISFPPFFVFLQIMALIILFLQFSVPVARFLAEIESPAGILDVFTNSLALC
jgi:iron(III) transport system permease protein